MCPTIKVGLSFLLACGLLAFSDVQAMTLKLDGITEAHVERSPAGILVGIRLKDGSIINPSFTTEDLKAGQTEKHLNITSHDVESCEYTWLLEHQSTDVIPLNFDGVMKGVCEITRGDMNEELTISPSYQIRNSLVLVKKSAFDKLSASSAILMMQYESLTDKYGQRSTNLNIGTTPAYIQFSVIADSELSVKIRPLWRTLDGLVHGELVEFVDVGDESTDYIFE